jgi:hypothetical protein
MNQNFDGTMVPEGQMKPSNSFASFASKAHIRGAHTGHMSQ